MFKQIRDYVNETKLNTTTEYKRIKKQKGSKLFYWLIIASLIAAFVVYVNDVRSSTKAQTEGIHQEFKQLRDEIRFELKKQDIDIDKKLEEHRNRIEEVKQAKKAEEARLAAVQSARQRAVQRPQPVSRPVGNCEAYRPLVSQYSWNVEVALAVMKAESGCNPAAANWGDRHNVCIGSFGLMQLSCHSGQVYDPAQNIAIAYAKYQARGWQPWGVCNTGKVKCI